MTTLIKERIIELREEHPEYTQTQIGIEAHCSREYVRVTLTPLGLNKREREKYYCRTCGKECKMFYAYCGPECRKIDTEKKKKEKLVTRKCDLCGKDIVRPKCQYGEKFAFCNRTCLGRYTGTHFGFFKGHKRGRKSKYGNIVIAMKKENPGIKIREICDKTGASYPTVYAVLYAAKLLNVAKRS